MKKSIIILARLLRYSLDDACIDKTESIRSIDFVSYSHADLAG